ncbi:NACHT domain-containing protein [Amycolatopsis sp. NPDC049868]|uniref:NACHT domain-containing protein n=1 Tax=Amycolatopsis sp. NPDC049868 TaxID=3363934 RepID=UPI00379B1DE5
MGFLLLAVSVVAIVSGDGLEEADQRASVVGAGAGVCALTLALFQELRARRDRRTRQPADLNHLADQLAENVAVQWQGEERVREIHAPLPMPLRWTNADHLADEWAAIRRAPADNTSIDLTGCLEDIADVFSRVPSHRLVVVGKPGAGKTILATRFVLDYLARRRQSSQPVPVIFSLASWVPTERGFRDWLADQLATTYPQLATPTGTGTTAAHRLVATGRILPVLDGFDEINHALRNRALDDINRALNPHDPLLLTSRHDEYATATRVITGTAVLAVQDLTVDDIGHYLRLASRDKTTINRGRWDPLLDRLRVRGQDPAADTLTAVLSVPLMLFLARTIYDTPAANPASLLDIAATGDNPQQRQRQVESHLLSNFIPAVYHDRHDTGARTWHPRRVQRWLPLLAHSLHQRATDDLAWWHLGHTLRSPRMTVSITFGLAATVFTGVWAGVLAAFPYTFQPHLAAGLDTGFVAAIESGLAAGLTFGLPAGIAAAAIAGSTLFASPHSRWPRLRLRNLVTGLTSWLICWSAFSIGLSVGIDEDHLAYLPAAGFGYALIVALKTTPSTKAAEAANPDHLFRTDRSVTLIRTMTVALAAGAAAWLAFKLIADEGDALLLLTWTFAVGSAAIASSSTAWGHSLAIRGFLAATGRLPWSLRAFLRDAHHRGVLRQVGPVYRFRHTQLRDQLAHEHTLTCGRG